MNLLSPSQLKAEHLRRPDVRFSDGEYTYVTSGKELGHGGMGSAFLVTRFRDDEPGRIVVAKTFREDFLATLREDAVSRRLFDHFERVLETLAPVDHPNVLPVLKLEPIADNFLLLTPLAGPSLLNVLATNKLSPRERVDLFLQALTGLAELHRRGVVHRDFTLHNVLTLGDRAVVFDFDISVVPGLLPDELRSYGAYYEGRILGAPEFSIAPELLDDVLGVQPLTPRIDVYAAGSALYALFSEDSLYGPVPDLASLLERIAHGVVHKGQSLVRYAEAVPAPLWPILETCLEREPADRYANAGEVKAALERALEELSEEEQRGPFRKTQGYDVTQVSWSPEELFEQRADPSVTMDEIALMELTLGRHGYLVEQSLGRVKGHAIYLAMPDPELVGSGRFPDDNTYRKIVTAIELGDRTPKDRDALVATWLTRILPIVQRVRSGYLTPLYKIVHDREAEQLLLFTEYIADPRFGTDLEPHELELTEALGLGLIGALSIARLHDHGLAHNHVEPRSLVFKGFRATGQVQPLFLGLVEPTFDPEARAGDVRQLAALVLGLIRPARIDALEPALRPEVLRLRDELAAIASAAPGDARTPSIDVLAYLLKRGLGTIDPNFELVRTHEGDVAAYADLLVRHSLYNKLYLLDVRD